MFITNHDFATTSTSSTLFVSYYPSFSFISPGFLCNTLSRFFPTTHLQTFAANCKEFLRGFLPKIKHNAFNIRTESYRNVALPPQMTSSSAGIQDAEERIIWRREKMVYKTHVDENRKNRGKKLPPIATDSVLRLSASTSLRSQPTPVGVDVGVRVW